MPLAMVHRAPTLYSERGKRQMKVTLAHPVSSLRGSVNHQTGALAAETLHTSGLVFFPWKGLQLARELVIPANPRTSFQIAVRNIQTALARAWSATLTANQRAAWIAWASGHGYVDGFQAFCSLAWINYAKDGTLLADAPTGTAPAMAATLDSCVADISSGSLTPTFSGVTMSPAGDVLTLVEWTTTKIPGAQQVRDTDYRMAAASVADSIILDTDPTDAGFTATIASGLRTADVLGLTDRRYVRYKVFDQATGILLLTLEGEVTIQA